MSFTVGLTGGIASGKSHIAALFEKLGVPLLDADQVSRRVVEPGTAALAAIAARFGSSILLADGSLDRRALRAVVFADSAARRDLEALTHPAIRDYIQSWREAQAGAYSIIANAILVESGMYRTVDRVLLVDASPECQLRRLLARDGMDEAGARRMLAAQASREERLAQAHDVIDNGDEKRDPAAAVTRLDGLYRRLAADKI